MNEMGKLVKYGYLVPILKELYVESMKCKDEPKIDIMECIENHRAIPDPVFDFLVSFDYETVMAIQAVMYIGREYRYPEKTEKEYEQELEYNDFDYNKVEWQVKQPVENPDALIDTYITNLLRGKETQDKEIEARQISGKGVLSRYLQRAFEILGI